MSTSPTPSVLGFAAMLDVLGFTVDEFVSLGHQKPGGKFRAAVLAPADAIDAISKASTTANMYFGVNPVAGPSRKDAGRGKESDVTRLAALWCDLDVKPGGCRDLDVAHAIVDELSSVLGTRPSAITHSGHGLHAYWPVDGGDIADTLAARALLRRWGRLVAVVAETYGARTDSVFDLPRMLRAPETCNNKIDAQAVPVACHLDAGGPLTITEVGDRLDEHGVYEEDTDRRDRAPLSDPAGWAFAGHTCSYMSAFLDGLLGDGPKLGGGRHQWLLKQAVRLACGWRLGCVTEADYSRAGKLLGQRLTELRAATGEQVGRFEVAHAFQFGADAAAAKTEDEARAELGDHPHHDPAAEFDESVPPIPLTQSVAIPPFPVEAFADPIADMVRAVAEATQTDPAMAATSALSVLATCGGGHAEIEIRSGWREPLCLHVAAVADPGERKSAVQQVMVRPVIAVVRQLIEAALPGRMEAEARQQIAQKEAEKAIKNAANTVNHTDKLEAEDAAIRATTAAAQEIPPLPRLVADDATPEAVGSLLADQKGRIAIISAEGGVFDIIAGRYSSKSNFEVYLKGHAGDEIRVDRKGRPPECIPRPALTVGVMIQPGVLKAIAGLPGFRERGLLARFLYGMPASRVGCRRIGVAPVPRPIEDAYNTHIRGLVTALVERLGDPAVLTLTPHAQEAVYTIESIVEPMLAPGGELATSDALKYWGSKLVGAVARIAGLLHLARYGVRDGVHIPVLASTVEAAWRIGKYFLAAATSAFQVMSSDPVTADAVYLLARIEHLGADEMSERDLFRAASRGRFKTAEDLRPALHRLVDHGYLLPLPKPAPTGGRPASQRYRVSAGGAP